MKAVLSSQKMAALDRHAIDALGIPGVVLMENAGWGVYRGLLAHYPQELSRGVVVVCGQGNNGGDGFVVARLLHTHGFKVLALLAGNSGTVGGDAKTHLDAYLNCGGSLAEVSTEKDKALRHLATASLVVDALFGTGLSRPLAGFHKSLVEAIGKAQCPVVAVDIPSGVSADNGQILGAAARAERTFTFAYAKKGHFLYPGADYSGAVEVVDIGIPRAIEHLCEPDFYLVEESDFAKTFRRSREAHKGHFGHVAILAGGLGKMGACALAALGALKAGAGLVTVAYPAGLAFQANFAPEIMTLPLGLGEKPSEWSPALFDECKGLVESVDSLVIGPGMGLDDGTLGFLELVTRHGERPSSLFDADAITMLATKPALVKKLGPDVVLTPHPGEAARLLGVTNAQIQADREGSVRKIAQISGSVALLKGAHSLVCEKGGAVGLINAGNPGMATAGSGDVLSGVTGAFLARGIPAGVAARVGALVHAIAGDMARDRVGAEGMTAGDILAEIPGAMKKFTN